MLIVVGSDFELSKGICLVPAYPDFRSVTIRAFKIRAEYSPGFFVRQNPRGVELSDIIAVIACDRVQQAFAQYGDNQGRVQCELTGKMVTIDDAHLDHAWPYFSHMVSGFRAARGWSRDIPDGIVSAPADGQTTATFVDSAVTEAFRAFHHDQVVLRILSREANLQTASSARRPKVARPVRLM